MVLRNEIHMTVVRLTCDDIVWTSMIEEIISKESEMLEKFIRELHGVASHVNTSPNALGRLDNHKINFMHRQLHPSVIGKIDLLDSSKDVGQTGMISPWADVSTIYDINEADLNKYKNIRYDLFDFIRKEFPEPDLIFHVNSEKEYNQVLDKLLMSVRMRLEYGVRDVQTQGY